MTPRILLTMVALAYLLFVLYGSFVPLRISPLSFPDAILAFRNAPWLDMRTGHRSDWVANVLLFVPLACLWLGAVWPRRSTFRALASIAVFVACAGLAVSIEFTQVYFPSRTVSLNDMAAETIGAGLGVAAWWMFGGALTAQIVTGALMLRTTSWLERVLGIYLCGLVLWALLPLDLTLSPVEIYTKYKTGNLILTPFLFHQATWGATASGFLPEIARWVPVGLLCRQLRSRATFATQLGTAVGIAAAVELLQLFVSTRVADVNDILAAGLGAAIGNRLGAAFSGSHAAETPSELMPVRQAPAVVEGRAPVEGPALVEGRELVESRALVSPFLGVVAYLVLLTVTAFWPWAKVNLRDGGWLEWLSIGSGIATVAWCARRGVISWRPQHRVSWLALALGGWVLLCAVVAALVGAWGDPVEYRVRQFGIGLTLYLVTTNTFGHRGHLLLPAAGLSAVLLSFGLTNPAALALNQNVGAFAGIVLPLVGAAVSVTRSLLVQLSFGLAAATLVWLVAETRNRGAAVALVAMVVVLAAQSRRRVAALAMVALLVGAGERAVCHDGVRPALCRRRSPRAGLRVGPGATRPVVTRLAPCARPSVVRPGAWQFRSNRGQGPPQQRRGHAGRDRLSGGGSLLGVLHRRDRHALADRAGARRSTRSGRALAGGRHRRLVRRGAVSGVGDQCDCVCVRGHGRGAQRATYSSGSSPLVC